MSNGTLESPVPEVWTEDAWKVPASAISLRTENPIRKVVDSINVRPNPEKPMIPLSIGDPTTYGNFSVPEEITEALIEKISSLKFNGYMHSTGDLNGRSAVARHYSSPSTPLTAADVILTSGCSGAIDMSISVLANEGQNILIPQPGFPLYQTVAQHYGISCKHYRLLPEQDWQADVRHLESLIDSRTAAIVINNPSNPCGSVLPKHHLLDILQVAEKYKLPIISDEIYGEMVFDGHTFHPLASLSRTVPILSVGGLAKQFLVPGWRLGWILVHDRHSAFTEVRQGLARLSQVILGPNSLVQSILPDVFERTPRQFLPFTMQQLHRQASYCVSRLRNIPGLSARDPQGAMYVMVEISIDQFQDIADDKEFAQKLLAEESVFVLPGQCFGLKHFFRIVISPPMDKLAEAFNRMDEFCERHSRPNCRKTHLPLEAHKLPVCIGTEDT